MVETRPFKENKYRKNSFHNTTLTSTESQTFGESTSPDYWRLIYTIQSNEVEIIDFVLNIVDHKTYDTIFGYKESKPLEQTRRPPPL